MSYVSWGKRSTFTLADGTELVGHVNYMQAETLEIRTEAGEFVTADAATTTRTAI